MKQASVRDRFKSLFGYVKALLIGHYRSLLLLLLLGVFFPLQIFGELAEEVWENEGGFPWDEPILLGIHATATPQLDTFASYLTQLGVGWGVAPASIVIALVLWRRHHWRSLVYFLTTLIGSAIINVSAKLLLQRVRPNLWESPAPEYDYGFPSGHAMSSMTFVAALVILLWGSRWNWLVAALGGLFVLAIGWTRLYLGVHYPSDIVAGWLASIAWAVGVALLIKPRLLKN
ncbi:phosphatase PAP2 family protein [Nodosilinea sp. LEGE 06152]|uniref:phosphatase PAP2 family protein n=1 Tax=Nodosilinea sp. LEGE 06152 TaxID=2777966 RepID=UPI001880572E|nr:phosphatase PAP2 family protein [Nodosilinea sp. LEGE 06152]MBE9155843.1 phosphatase PAP2 family protein [Nodosilinea sp. LEGE 06152]